MTKPVIKNAAWDAYDDGQEAIAQQINKLEALLVKHNEKFLQSSKGWDWSGDMEQASALLGEVIDFLS